MRELLRTLVDWLGTRWWPSAHFEGVYASVADPWSCETSPYEALKRQRTFDAIREGQPRGPLLEIGCGQGVLTEMLGSLDHPVVAIDISPTAVQRARHRCANQASVRVVQGDVFNHLPPGPFGAIVLAEVLYYLGSSGIRRGLCDKIVDRLLNTGRIIVVDPWPDSRRIERALRTRQTLQVIREDVYPDRGRPYAITVYGRA